MAHFNFRFPILVLKDMAFRFVPHVARK